MKKFWIFLLGMVFAAALGSFALAEDAPCIRVEQTEAPAGGTVELTVSLENNPGIAAATVEFDYDAAKLSPVSYSVDDGFDKAFMLVTADEQTGTLAAATMRNRDYNGAVLHMEFQVLPGSEGTASVGIASASFYDYDENEISFEAVSGGVTITGETEEAPEPTKTEENSAPASASEKSEQEIQRLMEKDEELQEYGIELPEPEEMTDAIRNAAAAPEEETDAAPEEETDAAPEEESGNAEDIRTGAEEKTPAEKETEKKGTGVWLAAAGVLVLVLLGAALWLLGKKKRGYVSKH